MLWLSRGRCNHAFRAAHPVSGHDDFIPDSHIAAMLDIHSHVYNIIHTMTTSFVAMSAHQVRPNKCTAMRLNRPRQPLSLRVQLQTILPPGVIVRTSQPLVNFL